MRRCRRPWRLGPHPPPIAADGYLKAAKSAQIRRQTDSHHHHSYLTDCAPDRGRRSTPRVGWRPSAEGEVELAPDAGRLPARRPAADEPGMRARMRPAGCLEHLTPCLIEIEDAAGDVVVGAGQTAAMGEQTQRDRGAVRDRCG